MTNEIRENECSKINLSEFYEDRYKNGYMVDWPIDNKKRISEVIRNINLPEKGIALDYGCGNGVLTEFLKNELPNWKIFGIDISKTAIQNAKNRFKGCTFFEIGDEKLKDLKFDFVFTHHVFEHVEDVHSILDEIDEILKPCASMLHILPCGNEGSYEHNICLLVNNGINKKVGNRFFFEEEGHLRRFTSNEFVDLIGTKGFYLQKEFYNNNFYGAIDWITSNDITFVKFFSDSKNAVNIQSEKKLKKIQKYLILLSLMRNFFRKYRRLIKISDKKINDYFYLLILFPLYLVSGSIDKYCKIKARKEWETKKHNSDGSEMFLYFKRE